MQGNGGVRNKGMVCRRAQRKGVGKVESTYNILFIILCMYYNEKLSSALLFFRFYFYLIFEEVGEAVTELTVKTRIELSHMLEVFYTLVSYIQFVHFI